MWTRYGKWDNDGLRVRNQRGQVIYELSGKPLKFAPYRGQGPEREAQPADADIWTRRNIKSG